jgi:PTH1 family peptidyl-tRNA hydrolase
VKIVVGLGNPGKQYDGTRHNVGWMVLDRIADRAGWSGRGKERDSAYSVRGRWADTDLLLVKPLTFMNLSGLAVRKALARERVPMEDLLVVVDDFALPLGRMRLREEGSAGGHNGLKSIIAEMGTQKFARLRVGIGEPGTNVVDHVLSRFQADERDDLATVLGAAATAVEDWAREGTSRAANKWNAWTLPTPATEQASRAPTAVRSTDLVVADEPGPVGDGGRSAPDANGVVRTKTGWRKLLPSGGHEEHDR